MAEYEEKFIVINKKYLSQLPAGLFDRFSRVLTEMQQFLPDNKYYVCNQDEPYAQQVIDIILAGENAKVG